MCIRDRHTVADILFAEFQFGSRQSIHFIQGKTQFVTAKHYAHLSLIHI